MLLYGWNRELAAWAAERLALKNFNFGPCVSIGVVHKGELVAAAIYNEYRHPNIQITFVTTSPRWASPGAVRTILQYPFRQLGCKRITAITDATNQPARAFLCRLGFKEEGVHPDALPSGDAVTYGLVAKDAARWLSEENTRVKAATAGTT
jgi:RimJ/RimL family protein N-acetyltransferase